MGEGTKAELKEIEEGFWKAAGSDGKYYEMYFAKDGVMVLPFENGILNKSKTIESVRQAKPWDSFTFLSITFLTISSNSIAFIYKAIAQRDKADYNAYVCSIYCHDGEKWQLRLHQQTPLLP